MIDVDKYLWIFIKKPTECLRLGCITIKSYEKQTRSTHPFYGTPHTKTAYTVDFNVSATIESHQCACPTTHNANHNQNQPYLHWCGLCIFQPHHTTQSHRTTLPICRTLNSMLRVLSQFALTLEHIRREYIGGADVKAVWIVVSFPAPHQLAMLRLLYHIFIILSPASQWVSVVNNVYKVACASVCDAYCRHKSTPGGSNSSYDFVSVFLFSVSPSTFANAYACIVLCVVCCQGDTATFECMVYLRISAAHIPDDNPFRNTNAN